MIPKKYEYFPANSTDLALNVHMDKNEVKDWKTLKEQFLAQFNGSANKDLVEIKLMKRNQGKHQSLLEYLTDVVHLCKICDDKMEEKKICRFVLKGLKPEVITAIGMRKDKNTRRRCEPNCRQKCEKMRSSVCAQMMKYFPYRVIRKQSPKKMKKETRNV